MNIFVIHKSDDQNEVIALTKRIKKKVKSTNFLILTDGNDKWKKEAKDKIKIADCILVVVGEHTHKSQYVDYEINLAKKYRKKIFVIRLDNKDYIINKTLFLNDKFMEVKYHKNFDTNRRPLFKEITAEDFIMLTREGFDFDLQHEINKTKDPKRIEELIEQYKIYLATSEDVITRRQNASSFYIGTNTAIIGVLTTVAGLILGLENISNKLMIISIIAVSSAILGIIICSNWYLLLDSYGKLNSAKMKVISTLEKDLPANIYDTEWRVMNEKIGNTKYRSFTNIEKRVPLTFLLLYCIVIILSIVALSLSFVI